MRGGVKLQACLGGFLGGMVPALPHAGPYFQKLAANYGDQIIFAKVNVDELPEVAGQYGIRSIPTLMLMRGGEVLEELVGARPYEDLARVLDRHLATPDKCAEKSAEKSPARVSRMVN